MTEIDRQQIASLIAKAESAGKSEDALRFSQAALNAANTVVALMNADVVALNLIGSLQAGKTP